MSYLESVCRESSWLKEWQSLYPNRKRKYEGDKAEHDAESEGVPKFCELNGMGRYVLP